MRPIQTLALNESEVARQIGISVSGLRKWRRDGKGPRAIRLGRLIRYLAQDVEQYLLDHAINATESTTDD